MQFDYAWKWFDFHAKQRTTMFSFYIIVIAATLGAVAALAKPSPGVGLSTAIYILCIFGIVVSILFFLLDKRNVQLLRYGELNLVYLEKVRIFAGTDTVYYEDTNRRLGLLKQEYYKNGQIESDLKGFYGKPSCFSTHSFIIPVAFGAVIILFVVLIIFL